MALFQIEECPHCRRARPSFTSQNGYRDEDRPSLWYSFWKCSECGKPVTLQLVDRSDSGRGGVPWQRNGQVTAMPFRLLAMYPEPAPLEIPEHLPENVASFYRQAAEARQRPKSADAACAMYRKTLETALKAAMPLEGRHTLYDRIDRLAEMGLLTPAMKEWAHHVRLIGNEIHEEEPIDEDAVDDVHQFTTFLLTYTFTLPEQVRLARERRNGAE